MLSGQNMLCYNCGLVEQFVESENNKGRVVERLKLFFSSYF